MTSPDNLPTDPQSTDHDDAREEVRLRDPSSITIFTTGEAAAVCGVSQQTIIRNFDAGRIGGFRVPGSRFRRIPRAALIDFMRLHNIPTDVLETPRRRVLIVEDDPNIVSILQQALERHETFDIYVATTGYDAGLMTEAHRPHLLILDYLLPDINGNVVCKRIRSTTHLSTTKILVISGVVDEAEKAELLASGADAFIRKPFDIAQVLATVSDLLAIKPVGKRKA